MRRVITKRDIAVRTKSLDGGVQADGFATRLVKYIPAETITALGVLHAASYTPGYGWDIAIAAGLNFLYLAVLHRAGIWQIFVSYLAFGVWVLMLGGEHDFASLYETGAQMAGLINAEGNPDTVEFRKAFFPGLALFVTLLGPVIDEIGDRFVVNR